MSEVPFRNRIAVFIGETYSNELDERYLEHRKVTGLEAGQVQYLIVHGRRAGSTGAASLTVFNQWQRKLLAEHALFSPPDMEIAHENFGAMCGHGAFAAATNEKVCYVMQYFEMGGGFVNVPMMKAALRNARVIVKENLPHEPWPRNGLVLLQWVGPWMRPEVPPKARCCFRHWVAAGFNQSRYVWDANQIEDGNGWLPFVEWQVKVRRTMPARATGWEIACAIAL